MKWCNSISYKKNKNKTLKHCILSSFSSFGFIFEQIKILYRRFYSKLFVENKNVKPFPVVFEKKYANL